VAEVEAALREGADVNAANEGEQTGLTLACMRPDWLVAASVVKLLLSAGCSASADIGRERVAQSVPLVLC
jgi:hypothetical protein